MLWRWSRSIVFSLSIYTRLITFLHHFFAIKERWKERWNARESEKLDCGAHATEILICVHCACIIVRKTIEISNSSKETMQKHRAFSSWSTFSRAYKHSVGTFKCKWISKENGRNGKFTTAGTATLDVRCAHFVFRFCWIFFSRFLLQFHFLMSIECAMAFTFHISYMQRHDATVVIMHFSVRAIE